MTKVQLVALALLGAWRQVQLVDDARVRGDLEQRITRRNGTTTGTTGEPRCFHYVHAMRRMYTTVSLSTTVSQLLYMYEEVMGPVHFSPHLRTSEGVLVDLSRVDGRTQVGHVHCGSVFLDGGSTSLVTALMLSPTNEPERAVGVVAGREFALEHAIAGVNVTSRGVLVSAGLAWLSHLYRRRRRAERQRHGRRRRRH